MPTSNRHPHVGRNAALFVDIPALSSAQRRRWRASESRNEKRAAVSRSRPRNNPALMVMPLREMPGISARRLCDADPIAVGPARSVLMDLVCRCAARSAIHITMPTTISIAPIKYGFRQVVSACLLEQVSRRRRPEWTRRPSSHSRARLRRNSGSLPHVHAEALGDDLHPVAKEINDHRRPACRHAARHRT